MRINKYFILQEFLDKETFQKRGWAGITLLDPRMLLVCFEIRQHLGGNYSMIINDWKFNNNGFEYRGFRPLKFHGGAEYSQHKYLSLIHI